MLDKVHLSPNAGCNFLWDRNTVYRECKSKILALIEDIYHAPDGVDGYRKMHVYLQRRQIFLNNKTAFKYTAS